MIFMKKYIIMLAAVLMLPVFASPALAARPSIAIDPTSIVGEDINYLETISFTFVSKNDAPWIQLHCSRDGVALLAASRAGYPGGWGYGQPFVLGPTQVWTSGGATCIAEIGYVMPKGGWKTENSVTFEVLP